MADWFTLFVKLATSLLSCLFFYFWSLVVVPPHPIRVCSSSHIYLCQPNKMTYRISALLRGLGRCYFLTQESGVFTIDYMTSLRTYFYKLCSW